MLSRWSGGARAALLLTLAAVLLAAASCGPRRKAVYPVRGQVLDHSEKPAAGARIVFHPEGGGEGDLNKPVATTDEQGRFALTTYTEGDGAPEGEYGISIVWPAPKRSPFDSETGDRLKGALSDPKKSGLRFKVARGADNEVPPIRLP
jgi:hypothetical protein